MAPGTILLEIVLPPLAHRPDLWPQDSLQHLNVDVLVDSLSVLFSPVSLVLLVGSGPLLEHFLVSPNDSGWEVL